MYYEYFGLEQPPFKIIPSTQTFYSGADRGDILDALIYAILNGEGIVKVVGEVGSGKTMLCRMLEVKLTSRVDIVYLDNPNLTPQQLLQAIACEMSIAYTQKANRFDIQKLIQNKLIKKHAKNKQVVLFVEEAQSMSIETLEELRLLANLETESHKLLQVVLFGQPELDDHLADHKIRPLRERITHNFNLNALNMDSINDYILFRLRSAGYWGPSNFSNAAIRLIYWSSKGLVRRVNILADKALIAAFINNKRKVTARQVLAAIKDCEFGTLKSRQFKLGKTIASVSAILVLIFVGLSVMGVDKNTLLKFFSNETSSVTQRSLSSSANPTIIKN